MLLNEVIQEGILIKNRKAIQVLQNLYGLIGCDCYLGRRAIADIWPSSRPMLFFHDLVLEHLLVLLSIPKNIGGQRRKTVGKIQFRRNYFC
jgi:hypothetical protein